MCPWALFELKLLFIFKISHLPKIQLYSDFHDFVKAVGSLPLLLIREHCLVENLSKNSAFSTINLSLCSEVGI